MQIGQTGPMGRLFFILLISNLRFGSSKSENENLGHSIKLNYVAFLVGCITSGSLGTLGFQVQKTFHCVLESIRVATIHV